VPILFNIQDDPSVDIQPQSTQNVIDLGSDSAPLLPPVSIPTPGFPALASTINVSKKPRYWNLRAGMMEPFEYPTLVSTAVGTIRGWDTDADQQLNYSRTTVLPPITDHLMDEGVEQITLPPLAGVETEEVALNQIPSPIYYKDHLSDENVELITATPAITRMFGFDSDAEQQFSNYVDMSRMQDPDDRTVRVFTPTIAFDNDGENQVASPLPFRDTIEERDGTNLVVLLNVYDNDGDNQTPQLGYYKDHLSDENVEKIILALTFNDWSDTSSNEIQQFGKYYTDIPLDEGVELITTPPFVVRGWDLDNIHQQPQFLDLISVETEERSVFFFTIPTVVCIVGTPTGVFEIQVAGGVISVVVEKGTVE
jgi:hypothetical protein